MQDDWREALQQHVVGTAAGAKNLLETVWSKLARSTTILGSAAGRFLAELALEDNEPQPPPSYPKWEDTKNKKFFTNPLTKGAPLERFDLR